MTDKEIEKAAEECVNNTLNGYRIEMELREDLEVDGINLFKDAVEYALSHQWVSVEDRLPEDEHAVLVQCEVDLSNVIDEYKEDLAYAIGYYYDGVWHFPDDWYYDCKVNHWMPIPKLRKGGNK